MQYDPPLQRAQLLRRYKRFLADVRWPDGREETVHCPNPGSMRTLPTEGVPCWLWDSQNPRRKYRWSLELLDLDGTLVCVNTARANAVAQEALDPSDAGRDASLRRALGLSLEPARREVSVGDSRLDFAAKCMDGATCWIEVKQVTMAAPPVALFPDARTKRGQRHCEELAALAASETNHAVLLFVVMRDDCDRVEPAELIDPEYTAALRAAAGAGVDVRALRCDVSTGGLVVGEPLHVELDTNRLETDLKTDDA